MCFWDTINHINILLIIALKVQCSISSWSNKGYRIHNTIPSIHRARVMSPCIKHSLSLDKIFTCWLQEVTHTLMNWVYKQTRSGLQNSSNVKSNQAIQALNFHDLCTKSKSIVILERFICAKEIFLLIPNIDTSRYIPMHSSPVMLPHACIPWARINCSLNSQKVISDDQKQGLLTLYMTEQKQWLQSADFMTD